LKIQVKRFMLVQVFHLSSCSFVSSWWRGSYRFNHRCIRSDITLQTRYDLLILPCLYVLH